MNKMFIFLILFLLTACANNQQGVQPLETKDALTDDEGSQFESVTYREGEITDIADINPNFLDLNRENEAHNNHGAYQEKLRQIVEGTDGFDANSIYINGYRAVVNVTPTKKFSKSELRFQRDNLEKKLSNAVPRYRIDLRINTDNNR